MYRILLPAMTVVMTAVFPGNIFINDVDIGGMTRSEAMEKLADEVSVAQNEIVIQVAEKEYAYKFQDFGADYDIAGAVDAAMEYSHCDGFFAALRRKLSIVFSGHRIEADFAYDEGLVTDIVRKISEDGSTAPREPSYAIENGQFVITEGRIGQKIDAAALSAEITSVLVTKNRGKVAAAVLEITPEHSTALFEAATNLIGSYITPFNPQLTERTTNLAVASRFLNNSVILPGHIFSTCSALRPRTEANGYVSAGQILNGELNAGIGGGICQITGTLYMAALHAEIPIAERRCHSLMVGYMHPATDAAIAEGHIDLKLENDTDYPMLIQSILEDDRYIINIYGRESRPPGRHITFESVLLETKAPEGDKIIEDPTLTLGISEVVTEGLMGAKYELYKIITEGGKTERTKINTSTYRPLQRVIRVGTAPSHYYP